MTQRRRNATTGAYMMTLALIPLLGVLVVGRAGDVAAGKVAARKVGEHTIAPLVVRVKVRAPRERPVAGAKVVIELLPQLESGDTAVRQSVCITGDDGTCTARVARAGGVRVTAKAENYLPTKLESLLTDSKSQELPLPIEKGGTLRGRVADESGNGCVGISVAVLKAEDDDAGPSKPVEIIPPIRTDQQGNFVLPQISTGFYVAFLHEPPGEWQKQIELIEPVAPVHVEEESSATMTMLVRRLGRIQGTLEFGGEVPGVLSVTPVPFEGPDWDDAFIARHQVSVPTNGEPVVDYVLDGLSPGEYRTKFEADGYAAFLTADKVLVPASGLVTAPPQLMTKGVAVRGTLRAAAGGRPISGANVHFFSSPRVAAPVATATTDAYGTFSIGQLAAGTYIVRSAPAGFGPLRRTVRIEGAQESHDLDLRAPSGAVIEGVYTHGGRPQGGIQILLIPASKQEVPEESTLAVTDADGRFAFRHLPGGEYSLILVGLDFIKKELTVPEDGVLQVSIDGDLESKAPAGERRQ